MWSLATAIAEALGCVTHDPDCGDVVDVSLDEEYAREVHNWL